MQGNVKSYLASNKKYNSYSQGLKIKQEKKIFHNHELSGDRGVLLLDVIMNIAVIIYSRHFSH